MKRSIFYVLMILLITASFVWSGDIYDRSNRLWTGTHTLHKTNTATATVTDGLTLKQSTTGTPAAGLGVGIAFQIEDLGGLEEQGSIDFIMSDVTDASENVDITLTANTEGTLREVYSIDSQASATTGTVHDFTSWTIETNGVIDAFKFRLDNTADTSTDGFGLGLSFEMEDETNAAEQQASIDIVLTDAGTTTEDVDIVFSQNLAGTIEERVRFDADGATINLVGTSPSIIVGDGGDENTNIRFDGNTTEGNFQMCVNATNDDLYIGSGTITEACGDQYSIRISDETIPVLTIGGPAAFTGTVSLGDGDSDTITINGNLILNTETITETASGTLTTDDCGKIIYLNHASTGIAITLPAASGGLGCSYTFVHIAATSDDHSLNTNGGEDLFIVQSFIADGNAGIADDNADIISFVDTADTVGDTCTVFGNGTSWYVRCTGAANGAFSSATS